MKLDRECAIARHDLAVDHYVAAPSLEREAVVRLYAAALAAEGINPELYVLHVALLRACVGGAS